MTTTPTSTRKNKSVESILLILLFAFGLLGFIYVFNGSKQLAPDNAGIIQDAPVSNQSDAANMQ